MAGWNKTTITICGGSNVARSVAAMALSRGMFDIEILVLGDSPKQTDRKTSVVELEGDVRKEIIAIQLPEATTAPESCISQSTVILLVLDPSEHEKYLNAIKEYIEKGTVIIALPSTPCFELLCHHILGDDLNVVSCDDIPWNAVESGDDIAIKLVRSQLVCSLVSRCRPKRPAFFSLQVIFGQRPALVMVKSWLEQTLICNYFSVMDSVIAYSAWKTWDGKSVEEIPHFYQNLSDECICLIEAVDEEIENIVVALMKYVTRCEFEQVMPFRDTLKRKFKNAAGIKNTSDAINKHDFFADKKHAMHESQKNGYEPDFKAVATNLEYFMLPLYNIASLCDVSTPGMKSVIEWCQEKSNKEYILVNELKGKDVATTRCPARFNFTTVDELVSFR